MLIDDQAETMAFLTQALGGLPFVEIITTHASVIFLAGPRAYKLKRAVRFPYLDYSTPDRRHASCAEELDLNRRTAPEIYVGVRQITREVDGTLMLDGAGSLVDAILEMNRFDQQFLFDSMARKGALTPRIMEDLAQRIAVFHRDAAVSLNHGGAKGIEDVLDINDRALRATRLVSDDAASAFARAFERALEDHAGLLEQRRRSGKVKRCHGDLTLRNICLWRGTPTLFDCIEFDEALATIDVLYDLSFLLMDLWHRDQRHLANLVLNRYLDAAYETDGLGLVPFFMAIRAAVRAHVTAAQVEDATLDAAETLLDEARQYFNLALALLEPSRPVLVAVGGLSGSGKSTVAALVGPDIGPAPGARVLNSDRIRKRLHGVEARARLTEDAYRPEVSEKVYAELRHEAQRALRAGSAVVVDAVFDRADEREKLERVAATSHAPFVGCWLEASTELLVSRVTARQQDPSDATAEVVRVQAGRDVGPMTWIRLDASQEPTIVRDVILRHRGEGHINR